MYGYIDGGEPISILRYKLNLYTLELVDFSYRDSDRTMKIKTSVNSAGVANIIIETADKNIPIGQQFNHTLDFYKSIIKNNGERQKSIKMVRNTSFKDEYIGLPYTDKYTIKVVIPSKYTGVLYDDKLVIYRSFNQHKTTEYHITTDGILELKQDASYLTIINKNKGEKVGSVECLDPISPTINISKELVVLNSLYQNIISNDKEKINSTYDEYGVMNSITTDIKNVKCVYESYKDENNTTIRESVHHLLYDNFNYNNRFTKRKVVNEVMRIGKDNIAEYLQVIYNHVNDIKEVAERDESDIPDFDKLAEEYFDY